MKIIDTYNLCKSYNKNTVIHDLNISVHKGEVFGFLGEDGSGKTTVIDMLTTKIKPTNGTAIIMNRDLNKEPYYIKKHITSLYKCNNIIISVKLYTYIFIFFLFKSLNFMDAKKSTEKLINKYDFCNYKKTKFNKLPSKIKRKVDFSKVFEESSDILFLDEPTADLDLETRELVWNNIIKSKNMGKTIIIASKSIKEIDRLCDKVCFLKDGNCLGVYVLSSIKEKYSKDKIRIYLEYNDLIDKKKLKILSNNEIIFDNNEVYIDVDLTITDSFKNVIKKITELDIKILYIQLLQPSLEEIYDEIMNNTKFKESENMVL